MADDLKISIGSKEQQYESILPQIEALIAGEEDFVANLANISATLKEQFNFFWVGFYLVKGHELVLGPFQGPVACTRIAKGKGVCGTSWQLGKSLIVPDVEAFPSHIACSSLSRSEIVVPVIKNSQVIAVLDVDSAEPDQFDCIDQKYLEQLAGILIQNMPHASVEYR